MSRLAEVRKRPEMRVFGGVPPSGRRLTPSELASFTVATEQMVRAQRRVRTLLSSFGFDPTKGYHLAGDGVLTQR